jgi:hypothetical protein
MGKGGARRMYHRDAESKVKYDAWLAALRVGDKVAVSARTSG